MVVHYHREGLPVNFTIATALATVLALQSIGDSPTKPCATYDICMSQGRATLQKEPRKALDLFREALSHRPLDARAFTFVQMLEPFFTLAPGDCLDFRHCMAEGYRSGARGDFEAALTDFKRALYFKPGDEHALEAIGITSFEVVRSRK
jgi:hypothetical protein